MRIEKASPIVFTALDDGTGVLLNLETLSYYSLNRTGVALWQEIDVRKALRANDLVCTICGRFETSEDTASSGVSAFIEQLLEFKMIRVG